MALPIFIGEKMAKHILSCSFGKDSIATALLALQHGEPLDELVYCEVMFSEEISGELPEHNRFIHETAIPYFEQRGIPTRVLRSEKTYLSCFYHVVTRGKTKGMLSGFPLSGRCTIQRDCKLPPIKAWATRSNTARVWNTWLCAIKTLNEIYALTGSTRAFLKQRCGSTTTNCTVCPPKCSRNTGRKTPRQNRNGSPQNYSPLCGERGISASCRAGIPRCPALWLATITTAPYCAKPTTARAQSAATFCCVRIFCCSADTSSRQNSYGKTILKLWMNCWPTRKMQKSKSNSLPASAKFCIAKNVSRNVPRGKKKSNH